MSYISLSGQDKKAMLRAIGVESIDDLFCCIPADIRLKRDFRLPEPLGEPDLLRRFEEMAGANASSRCLSFLGAGAYPHDIPSIVDYLSSRGEFLSPYTPYQPEVSQGTLQVIFEYQTMMAQLTGLDVANASLYEGATAAAEAVLMTHRLRNKPKILVARTVHPEYRQVIRTYVKNLPIRIEEFGYADAGLVDLAELSRKIDDETTAVVCQSPNFLGVVENIDRLVEIAHGKQALLVALLTEAASLGALQPPGSAGADIVAGEAQSFGLPLGFGGPYLGFLACRQEFVRQCPGRLVGETKDVDGRRGYVLTLSTREQHIRREKATSNICTNQGWCALRAAIYLEALGREGLRRLALQNIQKAHYALESLTAIPGVRRRFAGPIFNEFVIDLGGRRQAVDEHLRTHGVCGGLSLAPAYSELDGCALVCVTETHRRADIDKLAGLVREAVR
jgi:glycine dehydrogenase subunit 1